MCVAQQKPVGFLVHVSHLVFYAVEQSQLVKVAQCEHSRLVYRPVAASCVFGVYQGRRQLGRSNGFQFSIGSLLHPSVAIAIVYGSLHPTGYQTLVVHTRLYLDEISCRSAFAVAKVLYVNAVVVQNVEEQSSLVHNLRLSLIAQFAQFRSVLLEESLLKQFLVKQFAVGLIEFTEYVLAELLYLSYHVPVLVVLHILVYIVHNPCQELVVLRKIVYQIVNGITFNLVVVQFHAQVGSKGQFASQVAQYTLKERVDSLDTEVAVVVHYIV